MPIRSQRVTIADLARSLSLSTCTVSKILNRSFDGFSYSKETIRRVEEAARTMGYTANAQARSLRTRKTMLIGLLLPSAHIALFGALTDRLELELRNAGYQVLIGHSRNDPATEPTLIASLLARGIDGLIWIPARDKVDPKELGIPEGFPAVILDRPHCTDKLPYVATDNRAAARTLAERIRACGFQQVSVMNAPEGDRSMQERFEGIEEVFGKRIKRVDLPNEVAPAREAVAKLVSGRGRSKMVIALSEPLAIGALAGLRDLGLNSPEPVSFASFDDFPLAAHWTPRITVVRQDIPRLASEAVRLLLERIKDPTALSDDIRVPAELEWRDSVAEAAGK